MDFEAGDILEFHGRELTSRVIEFGTGRPAWRFPFWQNGPSHVGIVWPIYNHGHLLVESTTLCDLRCELNREYRKGVQFHRPADRIAKYAGRIERLRLADGWKVDEGEIEFMAGWFYHRRKLGYDCGGAVMSGDRLLSRLSWLPYPDQGSVFCSELVGAALMRLGRMPLDNAACFNPARLIRAVRRCGTYGPPVPVNASPEAIAA